MIRSSWRSVLFLTFVVYFPVNISAMALQNSTGIFSIPTKFVTEADLLQEHSRFMLANMKMSVNPCEDFYEFACGNWQNNSMIPEKGRNNTFFGAMQISLDELYVKFLGNTSVMEENTAETKAKRFFTSCMNMSEDLSQGYKTLIESIKHPVVKDGETLDWMILNFHLKYGENSLFPMNLGFDGPNFMYEISIFPHSAALTDPDTFNITKVSEDLKFKNKEETEKELKELLIFEEKLIATTSSLNKTVTETLGEFMERHKSSKVNWKRFFNLAFNGTFNKSWKINNSVKDFTRLNKFLLKSNKDTLFKYVKWANIRLFYRLWKTGDPVENICRYYTLYYFGNAVNPWFIETTYDQERRSDLLLMFNRIKDTFYSFLDQYSWLDSETRSVAKSKLRAMDLLVGYTDKMMDRNEVDDDYKNINMTNNYWTNLMTLLEEDDWPKFVGKTEKSTFSKCSEFYVNAYYQPYLNVFFIPPTLSQLPLYHINLPNSLKFGGIASIAGHEIIHGFGSGLFSCNHGDKRVKNSCEESQRNFEERSQCLESQYNKHIYNYLRTDGKKSAGENIPDNGGLRIAYHSYLKFLSENPDLEKATDKPLPGMDFNNKQLFFLKFAQRYCDGRSPKDQMEAMKDYPTYAINKFRAMTPLMNMPEFSKEFHCALGTVMNPVKKCVIW